MDSRKRNPRSKDSAKRIRLHKYLAMCGVGSRRACERLIEAGRVSVDGRVVVEQGTCVEPGAQVVAADGKRVEPERKKIIILLNKPRDVICTSSDPGGRRTFKALLPELPARLYTVGRLDRSSEGLLVVTNDGELAFRLSHPGSGVEKKYRVWVDKKLTPDEERRARKGVRAGRDILRAGSVRPLGVRGDEFVYELCLSEGRNRHIRRLFGALGIGIRRLKRTALGPLKLGGLRSGAWRYVRDDEIDALWQFVLDGDYYGKGGVP